jgi:hypothetical protein
MATPMPRRTDEPGNGARSKRPGNVPPRGRADYRFYLADNVIKYPPNEYKVKTLVAHNASYFSSSRLAEFTGVKMSPSTVQGLVNLAKSGATDIDLVTTIVPVSSLWMRISRNRFPSKREASHDS